MQAWRQIINPHEDIRMGRLDESVFAADLSDVVADRGPGEYRDARTFFRKTYPTTGLQNLMAMVLGRLAGVQAGEPVVQVQTPFGGGKTHSLIALYHLFRGGEVLHDEPAVASLLERVGIEAVPSTEVVVFVGTAADPVNGRTPWGELAHQLGHYALLEEHDRKRLAPGKDLLHRVIGEEPTLILMDELAEYAVKAKAFRDQLNAFLQELTETVKVSPRCALVVGLPSSAPYGEEGERALHELLQIFKRVETVHTPVEGEEVYGVIRRRLFEPHYDESEARQVVETFWEMYQALGDDVPREVREPAYRERMLKAYPFHPELIDVLYERWGTFHEFQRTRGTLRLLALIVADLYQQGDNSPLMMPSHIRLANPAIRNEFIRHTGQVFEGIIRSDIEGDNAKAEEIDRTIGSEYARFGIARGLARAIFFESFSGSEKRGVSVPRLRLAVMQVGMPRAAVGDTLRRLEEELWYLHVDRGFYAFSTQPNLNRVLVEREGMVTPEQVDEEIRRRTEAVAGKELGVYLYPRDSQDIPDSRELKLAVLSPDHTHTSDATKGFVKELHERSGQTFRTYRNALLVLVADQNELLSLRQQVKRLLALQSIQSDRSLMRQLSEENRHWLESRIKDSEGLIPHTILSCYRHLTRLREAGVEWYNLGLPTTGVKTTLEARVLDYLKREEILAEPLTPRLLIEKALQPSEMEKPVREVVEAFLRYPQLPMILSLQAGAEAVRAGVRQGIFGVRLGEQLYYYHEPPHEVLDGVLVRKEAIPQPNEVNEAVGTTLSSSMPTATVLFPEPHNTPTETVGATLSSPMPMPAPTQPGKRHYQLRVRIDGEHVLNLFQGVVQPLRVESTKLSLTLELNAEGDITDQTLELKVRETLRQIGAQIEHEELT